MTMMISVILLIVAVLFIGAVWTRLSIQKSEREKAYWNGIEKAEKAYYNHVYGKYLHANA